MKKIFFLLVLLMSAAMLFTGCAVITNILDPLPEEYVEGVKVPSEYPDDDFEIYDDAIVFEAEEDDEEISLKYGTEDEIDDVVDYYEDLFEDNELAVEEQEDDKDEFYAKGKGDGFKFEISAEEASGNYEERAFATVVEVNIEPYTVGEETLEKMQGFWLAGGAEEIITDEVRTMGVAIEFTDMTMDVYNEFDPQLTNVIFEFIDDDSIKYTEDGEETIIDVTFETIDGVEVMSLFLDGANLHFEKSTYDKMMEYYTVGSKTLEKMQGFWLACGVDGEISDSNRIEGLAIEFAEMKMDFYTYFEVESTNNEFTFVDDDTINYSYEGEEYTIDITFETIDGLEILSMHSEGVTINFENSSLEDMMLYEDMAGEEGFEILLADDLTDADLEYWISDLDWYYTLYMYANGEYEFAEVDDRFYFNSADYTGENEYDDGTVYEITWYVYDGNLYVTYPDNVVYYWPVDFEYDGVDAYLYLDDLREGYEGGFWMYALTPLS